MIKICRKKENIVNILQFSITNIDEIKQYVCSSKLDIHYDRVTGLPKVQILTRDKGLIECKSGNYVLKEQFINDNMEYEDAYYVYNEEEYKEKFITIEENQSNYNSYEKFLLIDMHKVYAKLTQDNKYEIIDVKTGVKMIAKKEDFEKQAINVSDWDIDKSEYLQEVAPVISKESIQYGNEN